MVKTILFLLWIIALGATVIGFLIYLILALIPEKEKPKVKKIKFYDIKETHALIGNSKTSAEELELVIKSLAHYHKLPKKEGGEPPKKAKSAIDMIFTLSGHSNMDQDLRDWMFKKLRTANPEYAQEFSNGRR